MPARKSRPSPAPERPTLAAVPPLPTYDLKAVRNAKGAWEMVGPREAEAFLKHNDNNRRVNERDVDKIAGDIRRGAWTPTGESIIFDETGRLIDGQHRLLAVIKAGIAVPIYVQRGVPKGADLNIDIGSTRQVAETMRRQDVEYATSIQQWFNLGRRLLQKIHVKPTPSAFRLYQDQCADAILWGLEHHGAKSRFCKSAVLGTLVFAHPTNPKAASDFLQAAMSDAVVPEKSAVYAARSYVLNSLPERKDEQRTIALKILRCLRAFMDGESLDASHIYANDTTLAYFATAYPPESILRQT